MAGKLTSQKLPDRALSTVIVQINRHCFRVFSEGAYITGSPVWPFLTMQSLRLFLYYNSLSFLFIANHLTSLCLHFSKQVGGQVIICFSIRVAD